MVPWRGALNKLENDMLKLTTILGFATVLAGCASTFQTPPHECPLEANRARCASMEQAYEAAIKAPSKSKAQSVFEQAPGTAAAPKVSAPVVGTSHYPTPDQNGMPVFEQPKVMRVWIAPYVDADGNLRSGEYVYFSTPGKWNYGGMRKPGPASGIFEPSRPDALGFKANEITSQTARPAAPPTRSSNTAPSTPGQQNSAPASVAPANDPAAAITQPYQRLGGSN